MQNLLEDLQTRRDKKSIEEWSLNFEQEIDKL